MHESADESQRQENGKMCTTSVDDAETNWTDSW